MNSTVKHCNSGSGRRLIALLLALLLTACVLSPATLPVARAAQAFGVIADRGPGVASLSVDASDRTSEQAQALLDGIVRFLMQSCGTASLQEVLDLGLLRRVSLTGEWYVFALCQHGSYDYTAYREALLAKLNSAARAPSGTELQKYALLDLAMGYPVDGESLAGSVGSQGIMSLVFGLHLMNNGLEIPSQNAADVIRDILSRQLADGGWAISGTYGDVDVTAMTLQALLPHRGLDPSDAPPAAPKIPAELSASVKESVDRAVSLLASRQNDDAGFSSYGAANPESSSQVLVTLSALGIDVCSDPRFVKEGRTILDAISDYRLPDGSFSHIRGGESNGNATQQVCYACVAYLRFRCGQPPLYDLDAVRARQGASVTPTPGAVTPAPTGTTPDATVTPAGPEDNGTTPAATLTPGSSSPTEGKASGIPPYRIWGSCALALLLALAFAVLALRRRLTRRNALLLSATAVVLLALLWFVRIQTPEQYYASLAVSDEEAAGSVTLSIRCDTVAGLDELPADGVILAPVKIAFRDGDSVYDALSAATAKARLAVDVGGAGGSLYIRGIGALYEFDYGTLSGWMYYVNGEAPSESCSARKLRDGDVIEWRYTRDMGLDTEDR